MTDVVIIGGGPGGYEAALVGAHLGGKVTVIERAGVGGSAVLTDVVPSKGLIAVSDVMTRIRKSNKLGLEPVDPSQTSLVETVRVDAVKMNERLLELAGQQSADIQTRLNLEGVRTIHGNGRLDGAEGVDSFAFDRLQVQPRRGATAMKVAIDGEIVHLPTPLVFQNAPRPLQLLVPAAADAQERP